MQGLPGFNMRFNFQGVHPGFRRLKLRVYPGEFYILDASKNSAAQLLGCISFPLFSIRGAPHIL